MDNRFTIERNKYGHWELYDNNILVCTCDTEQECEEEKMEILEIEKK